MWDEIPRGIQRVPGSELPTGVVKLVSILLRGWLYGDSTRVWLRNTATAMASGGSGKTMNGLSDWGSGGGTLRIHQWSGASGASLGWLE